MAVTIAELIAQKESIGEKRKRRFSVETSVGTLIVKAPTSAIVADSWKFNNDNEGNLYIISQCVIDPNLKSDELLKAYGCVEPLEVIPAIFEAGEISRLAGCLLRLGGFTDKRIEAKLYDEVKN